MSDASKPGKPTTAQRLEAANRLHQQGRLLDAEVMYREVLAAEPENVDALHLLGVIAGQTGHDEAAVPLLARAVVLGGENAEVLANFGAVLMRVDKLEDAAKCLARATALKPDYEFAVANLAVALTRMGRLPEALRCYNRALEISPGSADVMANRAYALHLSGDLAAGWRDYESRFERGASPPLRRPFPYPWWDGSALDGKSLLLWGEAGVGDELWFAGMFPDLFELAHSPRRVVIECAPKLLTLFGRSFPKATVVATATPPQSECMHDVDLQIAAGSLAQHLRPGLASFPRRTRYLLADDKRIAYWKHKLAALGPGLKVGVCWRSTNLAGERKLSCTTLAQWTEVFKVPGVQFVSVQYDECRAELDAAQSATGVEIHQFPEVDMYNDLDGTAALLCALDLVISAPTAVSVLAAALGVATWQLNYLADWQCHGGIGNPWYRTMRQFVRQWDQRWERALSEVAMNLAELARDGRR